MYRCVDQLQKKADIASLCRLLGVSRSGYYAAHTRAARPVKACRVTAQLKAAFIASGRSHGSQALHQQGLPVGRYRVRTLMKRHDIRPVWKSKSARTTDSCHALPVAENILDRQFDPTAPNRAWVADITYIRTCRGWLYLAAVMDLYSRKLIGWAKAPSMAAELVCTALQMAIAQRSPPPPGLIVHSDRGSNMPARRIACC